MSSILRPLCATALVAATAASARAPDAFANPPLPSTNVSWVAFGLGVLDTGFGFERGAWQQPFTTQQVEAQWLFGRFTIDGGLLHAQPLSESFDTRSLSALVRVGWTGERFAIAGGPWLQWAPTGEPALQILPTLRGHYLFDAWGLSAGLFDLHGLVPFRLSAEIGRFGFGYVAPLGAEAHVGLPLGNDLELRFQGFAYQLFSANLAALFASIAWSPSAAGGVR